MDGLAIARLRRIGHTALHAGLFEGGSDYSVAARPRPDGTSPAVLHGKQARCEDGTVLEENKELAQGRLCKLSRSAFVHCVRLVAL